MPSIISIKNLSKTYASGFTALKTINLDIERGEIFALLGPNGAGKTTLIGIICGILNASTGTVTVGGHDIINDYRAARALIGLVPQELTTDAFESVWDTVSFSRGLFGKPKNPAHIEKILKDLSLWDKKDNKIRTLSGGMKRRVLIAKALSHEPKVLFLDEPTAGVDVELRKDMWQVVRDLRQTEDAVTLEFQAGVVPMTARGDAWTFTAPCPGGVRTAPPKLHPGGIAELVGLEKKDLLTDPIWVDTGADQLLAPLASVDAVRRAAPDASRLERWQANSLDRKILYVFAFDGDRRQDGRQVVVSLTGLGEAEVRETRRRRDAWLADQLKTLTPEERRTLAQAAVLLRRIAAG